MMSGFERRCIKIRADKIRGLVESVLEYRGVNKHAIRRHTRRLEKIPDLDLIHLRDGLADKHNGDYTGATYELACLDFNSPENSIYTPHSDGHMQPWKTNRRKERSAYKQMLKKWGAREKRTVMRNVFAGTAVAAALAAVYIYPPFGKKDAVYNPAGFFESSVQETVQHTEIQGTGSRKDKIQTDGTLDVAPAQIQVTESQLSPDISSGRPVFWETSAVLQPFEIVETGEDYIDIVQKGDVEGLWIKFGSEPSIFAVPNQTLRVYKNEGKMSYQIAGLNGDVAVASYRGELDFENLPAGQKQRSISFTGKTSTTLPPLEVLSADDEHVSVMQMGDVKEVWIKVGSERFVTAAPGEIIRIKKTGPKMKYQVAGIERVYVDSDNIIGEAAASYVSELSLESLSGSLSKYRTVENENLLLGKYLKSTFRESNDSLSNYKFVNTCVEVARQFKSGKAPWKIARETEWAFIQNTTDVYEAIGVAMRCGGEHVSIDKRRYNKFGQYIDSKLV